MSRTDVHRPWRVQVDDPYNRHRLLRFSWREFDEMIPLYCACGCPMCTGRYARRLARKQERVIWRSIRQELIKLQDHEDVDVGPISGSAWG
jgi:hypothetical protein